MFYLLCEAWGRVHWLQGAAASVSPASTPLLASCSPAIKKYLYIFKNIWITSPSSHSPLPLWGTLRRCTWWGRSSCAGALPPAPPRSRPAGSSWGRSRALGETECHQCGQGWINPSFHAEEHKQAPYFTLNILHNIATKISINPAPNQGYIPSN